MKLLIVNGPNLNMLGLRQPEIYGNNSYAFLCQEIKKYAKLNKIHIKIWQSNFEGKIVSVLQKAHGKYDGVICNLGAYTHTSIAILDALLCSGLPAVEVHLTDIQQREDFRKRSYIASYCKKTIMGKGFAGYLDAIDCFIRGEVK